jgi:hypothetical protein
LAIESAVVVTITITTIGNEGISASKPEQIAFRIFTKNNGPA